MPTGSNLYHIQRQRLRSDTYNKKCTSSIKYILQLIQTIPDEKLKSTRGRRREESVGAEEGTTACEHATTNHSHGTRTRVADNLLHYYRVQYTVSTFPAVAMASGTNNFDQPINNIGKR